jgi:hypothetical protein
LALGALLGLEPLDRLLGGAPGLPLPKVQAVGVGAERSLGVGDPVALGVVAEQGVGLPPGRRRDRPDAAGGLDVAGDDATLWRLGRRRAGPRSPSAAVAWGLVASQTLRET